MPASLKQLVYYIALRLFVYNYFHFFQKIYLCIIIPAIAVMHASYIYRTLSFLYNVCSVFSMLLKKRRFPFSLLQIDFLTSCKKDRQSRETAISVFKQEVSEYLRNDPYLKITE